MTFTAKFKITEVDTKDGLVRATASIEDGTLTQNTEHATGMELWVTLDPEHETQLKTGDEISAHGHFTA
jgi:hypothetical protein